MSERPANVFDNPPLGEGPWAGWVPIRGYDPFEDLTGPYYFKAGEDGRNVCAFRPEARHANGSGGVHGGCLMTLADLSLFAIANDVLRGAPSVTITLTGDFVGPARPGDLVEASGVLVRGGGSLLFLQGLITADKTPALSFSGVVKRLGGGR